MSTHQTKTEAPLHPLFQTGPEWEVTNYPCTVELRNRTTDKLVVIPKPYDPLPPEWWREQFRAKLALL